MKDKVSDILSDVLKKAASKVKDTIKTIAKGDTLPIFSWGKTNG